MIMYRISIFVYLFKLELTSRFQSIQDYSFNVLGNFLENKSTLKSESKYVHYIFLCSCDHQILL